MQHDNAISALHEALAAAVHRDLPDVEYERNVWPKREKKNYSVEEHRAHLNDYTTIIEKRRPFGSEVQVILFEELWGSTALGYGGIGGAAMTNAYTIICSIGDISCVYFGCGRLAYRIDTTKLTTDQKKIFDDCIGRRNMPDVRSALNTFKGAIEGQEDVI